MAADRPDGGPLRLAIVGLGPKGLFALERVLDHLHRIGPQERIDIDLFEPHPVPGAGPVYDPAQPDYLRMNFAAERLDMWWRPSADERLSFVDWRRAADGGEEAYPPRAQFGRYLADGLVRVVHHAPCGASVRLRPGAIRALERIGSTWRVHVVDGATHDYDEVLVTVGHGPAIDSLATSPWQHAAPLISAVFPVDAQLSPQRVPAGAAVAVRGFALTFLDAALALTEGRGGVFEAGGHSGRLRYRASDGDVAVIVPFSRSGRPMLAKPDLQLAAGVPALEAIARDANARILALPEGLSVKGELLAILAPAAGAALLAANHRPLTGEPARRASATAGSWLAAACDGVAPSAGHPPAEELRRSLDVGSGRRAPDMAWALGHTWRTVYPALVERLGAGGLADRHWPAFLRLAGQMERVSFGPPPVNAAKLLALIEAARVDLTHVAAGRITSAGGVTSIRSARGERPIDVVVNAVLAAPGAERGGGGLFGRLLADGHVRILSGRRGLDVGPDAGAIGRAGIPTAGLSVIGRATEDCVIGNDTLDRTLHPHADRWALRVAQRATRPMTASALA